MLSMIKRVIIPGWPNWRGQVNSLPPSTELCCEARQKTYLRRPRCWAGNQLKRDIFLWTRILTTWKHPVSQGSIAVPGSVGAVLVERPASIEEVFCFNFIQMDLTRFFLTGFQPELSHCLSLRSQDSWCQPCPLQPASVQVSFYFLYID